MEVSQKIIPNRNVNTFQQNKNRVHACAIRAEHFFLALFFGFPVVSKILSRKANR